MEKNQEEKKKPDPNKTKKRLLTAEGWKRKKMREEKTKKS